MEGLGLPNRRWKVFPRTSTEPWDLFSLQSQVSPGPRQLRTRKKCGLPSLVRREEVPFHECRPTASIFLSTSSMGVGDLSTGFSGEVKSEPRTWGKTHPHAYMDTPPVLSSVVSLYPCRGVSRSPPRLNLGLKLVQGLERKEGVTSAHRLRVRFLNNVTHLIYGVHVRIVSWTVRRPDG